MPTTLAWWGTGCRRAEREGSGARGTGKRGVLVTGKRGAPASSGPFPFPALRDERSLKRSGRAFALFGRIREPFPFIFSKM